MPSASVLEQKKQVVAELVEKLLKKLNLNKIITAWITLIAKNDKANPSQNPFNCIFSP